ncbi:iron-sulfur cluster assembly accessory protein [bacterium]|nr:iron-sulfur cluster assembly accessory protein [bacterium]
MGTFHDTRDPLHGITVVATTRDTVFVGRCHERAEGTVVLVDADEHSEGQDGKTNAEYLARAARFGVWKKHDRIVLDAADLASLAPLSDFYGRPGQAATKRAEESGPPPAVDHTAGETAGSAGEDQPVVLTPAAVAEVKRLLAAEAEPGLGLRLGVAGGGCSGLTYKTEFSARRDGDVVVPEDGFEVYLDRKSAIYLRGITLDHQSGLGGKGFQFQNPNATNTCGCGESFAV